MTKHTSGEWTSGGSLISCKGQDIALVLHGFDHGEDTKDYSRSATKNLTEQAANAALISAAPELLAALKNVAEMLEHIPETIGGISSKHAKAKAQAAISKAEGGVE